MRKSSRDSKRVTHGGKGFLPPSSLEPLEIVESSRDVAEGQLRLELQRDAVLVVREPERGFLHLLVSLDGEIGIHLSNLGIKLDGMVGFALQAMHFAAEDLEGGNVGTVERSHHHGDLVSILKGLAAKVEGGGECILSEIKAEASRIGNDFVLLFGSGGEDLALRFENDVVAVFFTPFLFDQLESQGAKGILIDNGTSTEIVWIEEAGEAGAASLSVPDKSTLVFSTLGNGDLDGSGIDPMVPVEGVFQRDGAQVGVIAGRKAGHVLHPRGRTDNVFRTRRDCGKKKEKNGREKRFHGEWEAWQAGRLQLNRDRR